MIRRKRRHSSKTIKLRIGCESNSDSPIHEQLVEYAGRLLGAHELTDTFLAFVLS